MKNTAIQGLLFDLDGVIADTAQLHYESWLRLAQEEQVTFNYAVYQEMLGTTREENLRIFVRDLQLDEATKQAWMDRKNAYFIERLHEMKAGDALPGIERLLDEADAAGLALAVASSSRNARYVLDKLQLTHRFQVIGDGHVPSNSKPAPDIFLWVAGALGIYPRHLLVIEDSPAGIAGANAGGFYTVGVGAADLSAADAAYDSLASVTLAQLIAQVGGMLLTP